jgi:hypothetical protein
MSSNTFHSSSGSDKVKPGWLPAIGLAEENARPALRWLYRPLKKSIILFLIGAFSFYFALCVWDAFIWAAAIRPTYYLVVIRFGAIAILSLVDIIALPFRIGVFPLVVFLNSGILFLPFGIVDGLTLSPAGERRVRKSDKFPSAALFLAGAVLIYSYSMAVTAEGYPGLISTYVLVSPIRSVLVGAVILLWVARNLVQSFQGRHDVIKPGITYVNRRQRMGNE